MPPAATAEKVSATTNWPLPEDRKAAVVRTDVARGLLTEAQARDACRGLGHPDTRIDTPAESDPQAGALAKPAAEAKKEAAENPSDASIGDLNPQRSGETAARLLDEQVAENVEAGNEARDKERDKTGAGEIVTAQDKLADAGDKHKVAERPKPVGNK